MNSAGTCANADGCAEQTITSCERAYGCKTAWRYLRLELACSAGVRRDVLQVSSQRLSPGSVKYRDSLLAGQPSVQRALAGATFSPRWSATQYSVKTTEIAVYRCIAML